MIKIIVVGAGNHSQNSHLPALKRYVSLHSDEVELTALCDLRRDHVEAVYKKYGFKRYYTDIDEMLTAESPDGCIAVTPIAVTARVATQVILAGIPLLMEKPPGATIREAEDICALVKREQARVMVSMNRRFNPVLLTACSYVSDRPLEYLRAIMLRHKRIEPDFFWETAIHVLDAIRHIAGDIRNHSVIARKVEDVWWYNVQLTFESGTQGILEIMPNCGCSLEYYEMFGPDYRILAQVIGSDSCKAILWGSGRIVQSDEPTKGQPDFVKNGTYNETIEFLSSIKENRDLRPSPAEVLQSVEFCHHIQKDVNMTKT